MRNTTRWLHARIRRLRDRRVAEDDRGISVVEAVIITAAVTGLALLVVAAISSVVNAKIGGISL
jgi:hypothetical protein